MSGQPPYDFVYVHTDIPDGMTIREWREHRGAERAAEQQAARPPGKACGWCSVLSASGSAARIGGCQALPCGSLRES
jgi:hypothetical protein